MHKSTLSCEDQVDLMEMLYILSWVFSAVCVTFSPAWDTSLPMPLMVLQPVKTNAVMQQATKIFFIIFSVLMSLWCYSKLNKIDEIEHNGLIVKLLSSVNALSSVIKAQPDGTCKIALWACWYSKVHLSNSAQVWKRAADLDKSTPDVVADNNLMLESLYPSVPIV